MFLQYYGLREQPFGVTPNPRYLYHGRAHREALASLIYGIEADLGFAAMIAEPGMGKTTLLFYLLEKFRATARTALLFQTQCTALELLRYLASELEIPAEQDDPVLINERIRDVLLKEARARRRVLVVIDEAQNLNEEALEAVRLLSDYETPESKLMHIILAGQPQLAEKLARPNMAQLLQRIAILNRLPPFSEAEEVAKYIAFRLKVAGYSGNPLFSAEAVGLITRHSGGVPRRINRICFNSLLLACALQKPQVDADVIDEVLSDLDVGSVIQQEPGGKGGDALPEPHSRARAGVSSFSIRREPEGPPTSRPETGDDLRAGDGPGPLGPGSNARRAEAHAGIAVALEEPSPSRGSILAPAHTGACLHGSPGQEIVRARQPGGNGAGPAMVAPARVTAVTNRAAEQVSVRTAPERAPHSSAHARDSNPSMRRSVAVRRQRSSAWMVLSFIAVPLLLLAAWLYVNNHEMLPGILGTPPAAVGPKNTGEAGDGAQAQPKNGTSVTLPDVPERNAPEKPKMPGGKRSQLSCDPSLLSHGRRLIARAARVPGCDAVSSQQDLKGPS